jgi:hypothetical protein
MWLAVAFVAITCAGIIFMIRFLIALLREKPSSVCYWVVPVAREPEEEEHNDAVNGVYFDDECCGMKCNRGDNYLEFLENEGHAKEAYASGLVAFDVRPASDRLVPRSIRPRLGFAVRERRLD